jgi:hypothetical protein
MRDSGRLEAYVRDLICGMLADPVTRAAMAELAPTTTSGSPSDTLADFQLRRERLIDLYTEGDIDRATFRSRQAKLDERIRAAETERSGVTATVLSIPSTFDELVTTWNESGIDFQRGLIEVLITSLIVQPAAPRRRAFDPSRLSVSLRA